MSAIDFLRDLGKHFRMGTMLSKDIVARRLQSDEGISFTEFSYQILQANDYLELFRRYNCTLELGATINGATSLVVWNLFARWKARAFMF